MSAKMETPPPGLSRFHPAWLIATFFGAGLLPRAPGTWGSLAALPFAWIVLDRLGPIWLAAAALAIFAAGWWAAAVYVRHIGGGDPQEVVIDEVAGQFLALATAPAEPAYIAAGFVLFRIADIWKPWPVSWADRRLPGGLGVMADDMLAGGYALVVLYLIVQFAE